MTYSRTSAEPDLLTGIVPTSRDESERDVSPPMTYNKFTNVHAKEDSRQMIVSTTGVIIHAEDISTGARSIHGMGQMSDRSIQVLLQSVNLHTTSNETQNESARAEESGSSWQQHGEGQILG